MDPARLYLQLYSLRHEMAADAEGTLRRVRSLGFDGVELAGDYGWTADRWRALLDETGLTVIAAHMALESLEADVAARLKFQRTLGASRIVVPSLRKELQTVDGYHDAARRLNALGQRLADEGFALGYHNHAFEFHPLDKSGGSCGIDILLAETHPPFVHFEFDTFWLEQGGRNAVEFIRQNEGHAFLIHAKDRRRRDGVDVPAGQGDVDFHALIPLCTAHGWPVILEYESGNAIESVRQGAAFLRPLLG